MTTYPGRRWLLSTLLLSSLLASPLALAGGSPRRVSGQHEGNCYNPILSPDGTKVAYEVNFFERRVIELYVQDLASSKEQQIQASKGGSAMLSGFGVESGGRQVTYELAWSPRSPKMYVFSSSGGDENYDIYLSSGGVLAPDPAADGMPAWSRDGMLLAFTSSRTGEGDLYLVDINKTENKPAQLTKYGDSTEWYPTWSPEGRRLLFVRHNSKGGDNIYLVNDITKPGETTVALTDWPSIQTKPSWSPDGKKVAFYSNKNSKEIYDLYVMDAFGGATPRVIMKNVIPNERLGPTWSPDGKALLVVKDNPEKFNPIRLVSVTEPGKEKIVSTGTQNNGDLQLVTTPAGQSILAFTAQGRLGDSVKSFKRVYIYNLDVNDLSF